MGVASFWLMGFQQSFILFLLVNFILGMASASIGLLIGSMVDNPAVALELMPALIVPQLLFAGIFIQIYLIPEFLRWAQYLCSLTYAIRLVLTHEFGDCETVACQKTLINQGVEELPGYSYWLILFTIFAVSRLAAILILEKKAT